MKSPILVKRIVSGLLLLSYLSSPLALRAEQTQGQEPKHGFYTQLLPFFINTQQVSSSAQQQVSITTDTPVAKKPQAIDVTLHMLNDNEQARMALEILDHYLPKQAINHSQVIPLEKFNIKLAGKRDVVSKVMPYSTIWGQIAFAADCTQAFDYDQLTQRQTITKSFAKNKNLRKRAFKAFDLIRSGQRAYLSYFEQLDETTKKVLDSVYFGNPALTWLNTNKPALAIAEAARWVQLSLMPIVWSGIATSLSVTGVGPLAKTVSIAISPDVSVSSKIKTGLGELSSVPSATAQHFLKYFFYSNYPIASKDMSTEARKKREADYQQELLQDGIAKKEFPYLTKEEQVTFEANLSKFRKMELAYSLAKLKIAPTIIPSLQDKYKLTAEQFENFKKWGTAGAILNAYGWTILTDTLLYFALKKVVAEVAQTNSVYNNYQTRLIGMAKIVRGLTMLADIADESGNENMRAIAQDIELFLDASNRPNLAALLDALETGTFTGNTSFLSNRPRILAANKLMEQCKEYFVRPLLAAGKFETFAATADYYEKHQDADKPVCFVEFVNDAQPRLELENCWNVLIDENKAVVISAIKFGKNGAQNAILNGPNGTGKSTNENAIALAYFLGKFGISCCSSAVMTPFDGLEVHRNEQEDVEKGESSFMAQKARFDTICARIAQERNKRLIIFMDEPLSGTVEQEAGRIIYEKCADLLANQKQAICIIATHAEQPTQLEADTHGAFVNYYVEVIEPTPGKFIRTYQLLPGLAKWWFNDADKRHRFVEWLSLENKNVTQN